MNRLALDAIISQYEIKETSGAGEVSWDNGVHCEIPEVVISGKAEQAQYTGKNLFDINRVEYGVTINGGGVGEDIFGVPRPNACTVWHIPIKPNTKYTLHYDNTDIWCDRLCEMDVNGICTSNHAWYAWGDPGVPITITTEANTDYIAFRMTLRDETGTMMQTHIQSAHIQFEEGSAATSYEPYTDGIPAPNPNYPIMPTFSDGTKVASRGRNLADAFIASDQYRAKTEKLAPNTFRVTRDSPTTHGGYGQIKIEGLPKNRSVCVVCSVRDRGDPIDDMTFARLYIWTEPNAGGYYASILHLGERGETTKRSNPFIATTGYLYCGMYPNLANDGDSAIYEIAVYLADDDTEACDPVYFDGGEAVAPELLAIPGTEYRDEWDAQTGEGSRAIGKQIFNGSERWSISGVSNEDYNVFYSNVPFTTGSPQRRLKCMSTHFRSDDLYSGGDSVVVGLGNRFIYFSVLKEKYPDESSFKQFIVEQNNAGNPVTVWFAAPEPVEFQTDPQPLVQPKGACNIIQTEGTMPNCPISAKYVTHK